MVSQTADCSGITLCRLCLGGVCPWIMLAATNMYKMHSGYMNRLALLVQSSMLKILVNLKFINATCMWA